jgi:diguanylate cyclase (GGDEF)-like protein/PAS domain S-box-containing protein
VTVKNRLTTPGRQALRLAAIYAAVAALWIAGSDLALSAWVKDPQLLTSLQTVKGWAFILFTAAALYYMLYRQLSADAVLVQRYQEQDSTLRALSQSRESIIETAHVWINSLDAAARITLWNRAAEQISGYSRGEVLGRDDIWELLYPDEDYRVTIIEKVQEILNDGEEVEDFETRIQCKDGQHKIIAWDSRRFFDEAGQMIGSVAIGRDITAGRRAEQALKARERELATLLANLPGMAYRCLDDEHWTMKFASSGCEGLTGYEPEALIDNRQVAYAALLHPDDRARVRRECELAVAEGRPFAVEYRLRQKSGTEIWVWEQARAVTLDGVRCLEGILMDTTQRKRMEQDLEQLATRDQLTGLYNRRELDMRVHSELARADRSGRPLALLWLDLDKFKAINDRYGHLAGDRALQQVSQRLQAHLRKVDCIARYGGEELVILLPELGVPEARETAERLRELVAASRFVVADDQVVSLNVSIGVAVFPDHGTTATQLYREADAAMYRAKHAGRNQTSSADTSWSSAGYD